jgi:hypothetical protein
MELREVVCESVKWTQLAQNSVQWMVIVYTVMNLRILWKVGAFLTSGVTVGKLVS